MFISGFSSTEDEHMATHGDRHSTIHYWLVFDSLSSIDTHTGAKVFIDQSLNG
ncbi:MAG: hypothetical protein ACJA0C_000566 [Candidatus Endobugula sp.]|jgi:hypothetical protein